MRDEVRQISREVEKAIATAPLLQGVGGEAYK